MCLEDQKMSSTFSNKDISKQILKKGRVRVPKYYCPDLNVCHNNVELEILELEKIIEYPMYSKPILMFSSIANFKIEN